ncbi:type III-B CRISPR module-associated protein Cmr5 [Tengunoibacter tsumagoiensis]|uniref:CRISPR type III-B/RAMP module-associated protein Cmr5 n=1 Tax=Tengunoibacter tsumagoiensis TaxID=2014871 RepID=A0A402AAA2_9CHLR|nr:type III-B CRISPR module-associated protein Cmr5 [Tengunoibacter tsumagoiensis]GCE15841.1 hypothetical protein KTT_57000 [Tengunoibacter tsumagoiensis]
MMDERQQTRRQNIDERQTRRQNIEQERARIAWEHVREIVATSDATTKKEYRSIARGLNSMIQINGLGPTLGFLKAKGTVKGRKDPNKAHSRLLNHINLWMSGPSQESNQKEHYHFATSNREALNAEGGLLNWITDPGTSSADYRRATTEVLAFGNWLRRFAEAELEEES